MCQRNPDVDGWGRVPHPEARQTHQEERLAMKILPNTASVLVLSLLFISSQSLAQIANSTSGAISGSGSSSVASPVTTNNNNTTSGAVSGSVSGSTSVSSPIVTTDTNTASSANSASQSASVSSPTVNASTTSGSASNSESNSAATCPSSEHLAHIAA